jgi:ATP-dependent RNA circularization protein (DNA/RNA ligase family)
MSEYHKIQSLFKRDMSSKKKPLIEGAWTLPEFEYLANNDWVFTEKIDGTNIRVILNQGKISFGGRTDNAQIPSKLFSRLNDIFLPKESLMAEEFKDGIVLYGEGFGEGIQKGGKYLDYQDFVLFDIRIGRWWLQRESVDDIASLLGLDIVPVVGEGTLYEAIRLAKRGILSAWGDFRAEGLVARPKVELLNRAGNRIITKIKSSDWLDD